MKKFIILLVVILVIMSVSLPVFAESPFQVNMAVPAQIAVVGGPGYLVELMTLNDMTIGEAVAITAQEDPTLVAESLHDLWNWEPD